MQWSTRVEETLAAGVVALGLAVAVLVIDPVGRVLVGAAALLLVAVVVRDLVLRPRLSAGDDGVAVRRLYGTTTITWADLRVRARTGRRFGVRSTALELEDARDDAVLVVLGRRDLGTDPERVGAQLMSRTGPVPEED